MCINQNFHCHTLYTYTYVATQSHSAILLLFMYCMYIMYVFTDYPAVASGSNFVSSTLNSPQKAIEVIF